MVGMSTIFSSVATYSAVEWGGPPPPIILTGMFNLVSSHALHAALWVVFGSMCLFRFDKAVSVKVIYLWLQRLKIAWNYISKSSGGACPRTPLATIKAFGTRDCPPPKKKKKKKNSNLATALHYQVTIEREMKRNKNRIAYNEVLPWSLDKNVCGYLSEPYSQNIKTVSMCNQMVTSEIRE